jgi:ABC-2 type transport system permease protein
MIGSVAAELLVLRKRASTWILLGIWTALALAFAYAVPYVAYLNEPAPGLLTDVLPERLVATVLAGFPFFGGVLALMLGVLSVGSEYGWGTLKTLLTQRSGRLHVFGAKQIALAIGLVPFVLGVFAVGALTSYAIAVREAANTDWPSVWLLVRGLAAGWLVLAAWTALGVLLGVFSRGTALATGIGVLYAFVIEGLLSAIASQVSLLDRVVEFFIRANAYSVVAGLGVSADDVGDRGPGSFSGPFVGPEQAVLTLIVSLGCFVALSGLLLRRRDVT